MVVLMMNKYNFMALVVGLSALSSNLHAVFLTEEEIQQAKILTKAPNCFEDHTQVSSRKNPNNKNHWLTLDTFPFTYKDKKNTFCIANSFDSSCYWGKLAIFPEVADAK